VSGLDGHSRRACCTSQAGRMGTETTIASKWMDITEDCPISSEALPITTTPEEQTRFLPEDQPRGARGRRV
jgi:hypothetical protein